MATYRNFKSRYFTSHHRHTTVLLAATAAVTNVNSIRFIAIQLLKLLYIFSNTESVCLPAFYVLHFQVLQFQVVHFQRPHSVYTVSG